MSIINWALALQWSTFSLSLVQPIEDVVQSYLAGGHIVKQQDAFGRFIL